MNTDAGVDGLMVNGQTSYISPMMRFSTSIFFLWVIIGSAYGQELSLDQMQARLKKTGQDTSRVNLLSEIAWELKFDQPDSARILLDAAVTLAKKLRFPKGEATAWNYKGVLADIHGNTAEAIRCFERALEMRRAIGEKMGEASLLNNLGNIYVRQGDHHKALTYYQSSLKIVELLQDTQRVARANYSIALAHAALGGYPEALNHLFEYLWYAENQNDSLEMAVAYNMIGAVKSEIELTEEALLYFNKARVIRESHADPIALANTYNNMGLGENTLAEKYYDKGIPDTALAHIHSAKAWYDKAMAIFMEQEDLSGQATVWLNKGICEKLLGSIQKSKKQDQEARKTWRRALEWVNKALSLRENLDEKAGIVEVYNALGDIYRRQGNMDKALHYTHAYMALAKETGQGKFIRTGWKDLSRVYAAQSKWKQAYEARKMYDELRWEEFGEKRIQDYERREVLYGDLKKQVRLEKQEQEIAIQQLRLREAQTRQRALIGGAIALAILAFLLYNRYRIKHKANQALAEKNAIIDAERKKSDDLLRNILPDATAAELKAHGKAAARDYASVTVLFTDFVGFTAVASKMSATDLVAELDTCFKAFDQIIVHHGIEKIKTVGDAYLAAGGLPEPCDDHALRVVKAAMDMQHWVEHHYEERSNAGLPAFRMRVGIHSGPLTAGVVGDKKFAYDIWGDTVNTASRVESAGAPGRINISKQTATLIDHAFVLDARGPVEIKGKEALEMYWVKGR